MPPAVEYRQCEVRSRSTRQDQLNMNTNRVKAIEKIANYKEGYSDGEPSLPKEEEIAPATKSGGSETKQVHINPATQRAGKGS